MDLNTNRDDMTSRHRLKRILTPARVCLCTFALVVVVVIFFRGPKPVDTTVSKEKGVHEYFNKLRGNETGDIDTRMADALRPKVRILCLILTIEEALDSRAEAVKHTWARRCDKYFFVLKTERKRPDILNTNVTETRYNIVYKTREALRHIHTHYMHKFDWLLKADDDTYIIMENLRYLLFNYDKNEPGYLGYHYDKFIQNGFMSGGAGYVMSNLAVRMLVEKGLSTHLCDVKPRRYNHENGEDLEVGHCLQKLGVNVYSSLDYKGRETFHPNNIETHLVGTLPVYVKDMAMNPPQTGPECCSRFSISYHYVTPEMMVVMEHLLYKTSVYGHNLIPDKDRQHKLFDAKILKKQVPG